MDCRKVACFFLLTLLGVGGCALPTIQVSMKSATEHSEDMTHKASTYVAFGDFRMKSAEAPELPPEQKRQLLEDARLSYLKALEVEKNYLAGYVGLARALQAAEDYSGAAKVYGKAIEMNPKEPALWFELGMTQCRGKDFASALGNLSKALELAPGDRHVATTVGYAMARAGQWDEACRILARVHGQAKAHYDLARMLRHVNQKDKALEHASAALTSDPNFEAARVLLTELSGGQQDAAVVVQTNAVSNQKGPPPTIVQAVYTSPANDSMEANTQTPGVVPANASQDRQISVPPMPTIKIR